VVSMSTVGVLVLFAIALMMCKLCTPRHASTITEDARASDTVVLLPSYAV